MYRVARKIVLWEVKYLRTSSDTLEDIINTATSEEFIDESKVALTDFKLESIKQFKDSENSTIRILDENDNIIWDNKDGRK